MAIKRICLQKTFGLLMGLFLFFTANTQTAEDVIQKVKVN